MPAFARRKIRDEVFKLIIKSKHNGIFQREIELSLGISKSYCSELVTNLERQGKVIRTRKTGGGMTVYATQFFPGGVEGLLRVGLLKSSEYIPIMALISRYFNEPGSRVQFRFYNGTFELLNDLRSHSLEFCLAPTPATVLSAILRGDTKVLTGLASGGSGIINQEKFQHNAILSTEVSSMISLILRSGSIGEPTEVEPYDDPKVGIKKFVESGYRRIAIWEPYFSHLLELPSCKCEITYREVLSEFPCCSIATTQSFFNDNRGKIKEILENYWNLDMGDFQKSEDFIRSVALQSKVTGMSRQLIRHSLENYNFHDNRIRMEALSGFGISLSLRQKEEIFVSGILF